MINTLFIRLFWKLKMIKRHAQSGFSVVVRRPAGRTRKATIVVTVNKQRYPANPNCSDPKVTTFGL